MRDAQAHPQPCVRSERAHKLVTTGSPVHAGIPCTMVTAYSALSLVIELFVTIASAMRKHCCQLDVSVETSVALFPKFVRYLRPHLHELRKARATAIF